MKLRAVLNNSWGRFFSQKCWHIPSNKNPFAKNACRRVARRSGRFAESHCWPRPDNVGDMKNKSHVLTNDQGLERKLLQAVTLRRHMLLEIQQMSKNQSPRGYLSVSAVWILSLIDARLEPNLKTTGGHVDPLTGAMTWPYKVGPCYKATNGVITPISRIITIAPVTHL